MANTVIFSVKAGSCLKSKCDPAAPLWNQGTHYPVLRSIHPCPERHCTEGQLGTVSS